jgi:hypothetical protein
MCVLAGFGKREHVFVSVCACVRMLGLATEDMQVAPSLLLLPQRCTSRSHPIALARCVDVTEVYVCMCAQAFIGLLKEVPVGKGTLVFDEGKLGGDCMYTVCKGSLRPVHGQNAARPSGYNPSLPLTLV